MADSELGCGFGTGSHWERLDEPRQERVNESRVFGTTAGKADSSQDSERRPLPFAKLQFSLGAIPGVNAAMSTGSGFGSGSGSGRGDRGDDAWTPSGSRPSDPDEQSTAHTAPRSERGARPSGQERTVSYQPEERYWTDYLRVALPVVGLLLMLGLFLFWANQLIDPDEDPTSAAVVLDETDGDAVIGASSPVATATSAPELTAEPATDSTAAPADQGGAVATATSAPATDAAAPTATTASEDTTAEEANGAEFQLDQAVQVNDTNVNLRVEATTDSDVVTQLEQGQQMTVIEGPTEGEAYSWYQVEFQDAAGETIQGWVASDFIEEA